MNDSPLRQSGPPLRLFIFRPLYGLPTHSPFTLKLATWMRLAGVPHEVVHEDDPRKGPKKKSPWVEDGDLTLGDSELVIKHLRATRGADLDGWLTPEQHASARCLRLAFEGQFGQIFDYAWFVRPEGWRWMKAHFDVVIPRLLRPLLLPIIRKDFVSSAWVAGIGRHSEVEIDAFARENIDDAARLLGDGPFLFGEQPCTADCSVFGFLALVRWLPVDNAIKEHLLAHENLLSWLDRMWGLAWSDLPVPRKTPTAPRLPGAALAATLASLLFVGCSAAPEPQTTQVAVQPLPVSVAEGDAARGQHLADNVVGCGECHGADLGGGFANDDRMVGRIVAPNLTNLDYDAEDWVGAIHHGVTPDGRKLLLMPSEDYVGLSGGDLADLITWLESRPPVQRELPATRLGPVGRVLVKKGVLGYAADVIDHEAPIPPRNQESRGAYLARVSSCITCHDGGPGKAFGPGMTPSANLTHHEEGLAGWTLQQFAVAVREGRRPDGSELDPFMPFGVYAGLSDEDVAALWEWTKSLEPMPDGA